MVEDKGGGGDPVRLGDGRRAAPPGSGLEWPGPPRAITIDDRVEIARRAAEARRGAPGIPWREVTRLLGRR